MKNWQNLLFIEKVNTNKEAFGRKVIEISNKLGVDPDSLMAVMNSESGINPKAKNPYGGATGLIQFMPNTAEGLGTTTDALYNMSNVEQLDYVYKYFYPYRNKLTDYTSLYLVTFYPRALGENDNYVFGSEVSSDRVSLIARQNPAIDRNKDGKVTMSEFKEFTLLKIPEEYRKQFQSKSFDSWFKFAGRNKWEIIGGILLIIFGIFIIRKKGLKN